MPVSRTAQYVALYRALETTETRRAPLFYDAYADAFLSTPLRVAVLASRSPALRSVLTRYADHRAPGARSSAIGRTRFIDDVVRDRVAAGTKQLVLLGAGFDARPYRIDLGDATSFEVDQPEMIELRARRFGEVGARVRRVAIDFNTGDLAASLGAAGFDEAQPSVLVWEGVTNYLEPASVEAVLAWVGRLAPGTTLVFTYIHAGVLDGSARFDGADALIENVRRLGEPWKSGILPDQVGDFVARFGLTLRSNFGADEYRRMFGLEGRDVSGYGFYRIAVAERA